MLAALYGHKKVVKILVEAGADVNAKRKDGKTALRWATEEGHRGVAKILRNAGASE